MYYYKFKLYYPNGEEGGGGESGDEGGGYEPGDAPEGAEDVSGASQDVQDTVYGERPRKPSPRGKSLIPKTRPITKITDDPRYTETQITATSKRVDEIVEKLPVDKSITGFSTNKGLTQINPRGEKREIKIKGTPTSIFSLTITDSSDCSILREKIENVTIPSSGVYRFVQDFPSIATDNGFAKTKETYTLDITPAADVVLRTGEINKSKTRQLVQIADPIITITNSTSQTSPALTVSGSDVSITGTANTYSDINKTIEYVLRITEDPTDYAGKLYIKNTTFQDNITHNGTVKKEIDRCGGTGLISTLTLKPLTTRTESTKEGDGDYKIDGVVQSGATKVTGDLEVGMSLYAKTEYSKTVVANLDEDNNIIDYTKCKDITTKFKLSDTNNLRVGMIITGSVVEATEITSIDCDQTITLSQKQIIKKDSVLTFKEEWFAHVVEVVENTNSKGNAVVNLTRAVDIPHGTEIEFQNQYNVINGLTRYTGSGSDEVVLTTFIKPTRFGEKNVTYTLDLDGIVTTTPNAYDLEVITAKETAITINMIRKDFDANATSKVGTVVRSPQNGTVGSWVAATHSFAYTPANGFTGEDSFTYTMHIAADSSVKSDEKTVRITVK